MAERASVVLRSASPAHTRCADDADNGEEGLYIEEDEKGSCPSTEPRCAADDQQEKPVYDPTEHKN
jgi:hypothetical protein